MNSELEILTKALVELSKIAGSPGERSHMLAYNIAFIKRKINEVLKTKVKR
jgi:hypothetical protein